MKELNVLVVDDEAGKKGKRTDTYMFLEKETIDGYPLKLTFAESQSDALSKIHNGHFHIILIDVVLAGWGDSNGEAFDQILKIASEYSPVAIVSSEWDMTSIPLVRKALQGTPSIDIRLFLRWQDLVNKSTRNMVVMVLQNEINRYYGIRDINRDGEQSIRILHLSDLHFGSNKNTLIGAELRRVVDKIKKEWNDGPDFVVITGDIANTGHPNDYRQATEWFEKFADYFKWKIPSRRFLIVPGNHDFNVALANAQNASIISGGKLKYKPSINCITPGLEKYAMVPFQQFAQSITGWKDDTWRNMPFGHWVETSYRIHGIVFSGFNGSYRATENGWPKRWLNEDDITDVEDIINNTDNFISDLFHITLSHHSPVKTEAEQPVENSEAFRTNLIETSAIPHLIFHGHEHRRDAHLYDGKSLVVCAPTPTLREENRPPDCARGFNMVELNRNDFSVDGVKVFSYVLDSNRWNRINMKEYTFSLLHGFREVKIS
ncbi:MAG: metallophosphoesterase [gamma proteobacterium symbiont of Taylorina sp.]|nr:metallophosphoesterase [gamma proteobacterium symbiont of Taylorina sp.]